MKKRKILLLAFVLFLIFGAIPPKQMDSSILDDLSDEEFVKRREMMWKKYVKVPKACISNHTLFLPIPKNARGRARLHGLVNPKNNGIIDIEHAFGNCVCDSKNVFYMLTGIFTCNTYGHHFSHVLQCRISHFSAYLDLSEFFPNATFISSLSVLTPPANHVDELIQKTMEKTYPNLKFGVTSVDLEDGCYHLVQKEDMFFEDPKHVQIFNQMLRSESQLLNLAFVNRDTTRRILNHEKLMEALEKEFPTIRQTYKDDMGVMESAADQIQFIQDSDILIKPHGNNMGNLMFLPKCAIAIQLYPRGYYIGFDNTDQLAMGADVIYGLVYFQNQDATFKLHNHTTHWYPRNDWFISKMIKLNQYFQADIPVVIKVLQELLSVRAKCMLDSKLIDFDQARKKWLATIERYKVPLTERVPSYVSYYTNTEIYPSSNKPGGKSYP